MKIERELIDDNRILYKATFRHQSDRLYSAYQPRPFEAAIEAYKIAASVESWLQKREDKGA